MIRTKHGRNFAFPSFDTDSHLSFYNKSEPRFESTLNVVAYKRASQPNIPEIESFFSFLVNIEKESSIDIKAGREQKMSLDSFTDKHEPRNSVATLIGNYQDNAHAPRTVINTIEKPMPWCQLVWQWRRIVPHP